MKKGTRTHCDHPKTTTIRLNDEITVKVQHEKQ